MTLCLGVNIDHIATVRQARASRHPEPVTAALMAQNAGAHGITVHLRGDRRHIQDRDVRLLKEVLTIPLNVECATAAETLETLIPMRPDWITLVPETREELTTQGGLDAVFLQNHLKPIIRELRASDIHVSLFIDPSPDQVSMASRLEADGVEFNTGTYAELPKNASSAPELDRLAKAARLATKFNLKVLAGHGLNLQNVQPIAAIPEIQELNIGHSIVARAVLVGIEAAVREMLQALATARGRA